MSILENIKIESDAINDFSEAMTGVLEEKLNGEPKNLEATVNNGPGRKSRINLEQCGVRNGLGQLVLTLVKLLHELLERQAIRRIDGGSLSESEIEKLGMTLMNQAEEIERLRQVFGLKPEDLNLDLGPLGRLL